MKLLVLLLAAAAAGGYIVYAHPNVVPQAEHAAQVAQAAIQSAVNPSPTAAPVAPPAPVASVPPVVLTFPSPTPAGDAVTVPPTAAPTPDPTASVKNVWSAADCAWAQQILIWDSTLDSNEVGAIINGTDTKYGNSPQIIAYYKNYAEAWATIQGGMQSVCDQGGSISRAQVQFADTEFATAIAAHHADSNPNDAAWTVEWVGYYNRLTAMMHATGLA